LQVSGVAGTAMLAIPSFGYAFTSTEEAAAGIIENELKALGIITTRGDIELFVEDYFTEHKMKENVTFGLKLKSFYFLGVSSAKSYVVSELIKSFLLSTDFFMNKMDVSKPLKYTGIYSPYKKPCSNPFSFFYYPQKAV